MKVSKLETLKAILNRANRQYDRGEITKEELKKILFDIYYEYRKIIDEEEDDDFFFPLFNRKNILN